jgi:hypothetical protein
MKTRNLPYAPRPIFPDRNTWERICASEYDDIHPYHDPVRFYVWIGRGLVRLALSNGDSVTHRVFSYHDEGWTSRVITITRDRNTLLGSDFHEGTDCDGYQSTYHMFTSAVDDLNERGVPNWTAGETRCRDAYAEAAGY